LVDVGEYMWYEDFVEDSAEVKWSMTLRVALTTNKQYIHANISKLGALAIVKRNSALYVARSVEKTGEQGILIGDEIITLNDEYCRGVDQKEFSQRVESYGEM
jgi:hypothetical protein